MADDMPALHPNDAALSLFRDTLGEMRDTNAKVGEVREMLAEMKGQNLPARVDDHSQRLTALANRVGDIEHDAKELAKIPSLAEDVAALKNAQATAVAVRKPWVAIAVKLGELLLAAAVGGLGALAGMASGGTPPHHP